MQEWDDRQFYLQQKDILRQKCIFAATTQINPFLGQENRTALQLERQKLQNEEDNADDKEETKEAEPAATQGNSVAESNSAEGSSQEEAEDSIHSLASEEESSHIKG